MILLVDLCYKSDSLSSYEFVNPIAHILDRIRATYRIVHYSELSRCLLDDSGKIILCGTALKDNDYCRHLESFCWLNSCNKPVLGICAGMQVIGSSFGGEIVPQPSIGLEKIDIIRDTPLLGKPRAIEGYLLHSFGVTLPESFNAVAGSLRKVDAFLHFSRPIYGIIFHPEVRNKWIVEKFADL